MVSLVVHLCLSMQISRDVTSAGVSLLGKVLWRNDLGVSVLVGSLKDLLWVYVGLLVRCNDSLSNRENVMR